VLFFFVLNKYEYCKQLPLTKAIAFFFSQAFEMEKIELIARQLFTVRVCVCICAQYN
jgi:hypothetical protein